MTLQHILDPYIKKERGNCIKIFKQYFNKNLTISRHKCYPALLLITIPLHQKFN